MRLFATRLTAIAATLRRAWSPSSLFSASEPGAWYDPSDTSTLFQDSAGTVPVTAVEQPVGRILDTSGRGNHAIQATTTKRPVLSRRVNLFSDTESPSAGSWATVLANVAGLTVTPTTSSGQHYIYSTPALAVPGSAVVRFTARANGYTRIMLREGSVTGNMVLFDLIAGTVVNTQVYTGSITASVDLPGWFDCTVNLTGKSQTGEVLGIAVGNSSTTNWASAAFAGDGVSGVDVTRLQFVRATDAHLPYQRVNTATDYDADPAKFPAYLRFDGVDDVMVTVGNVNLSGTDKVTVWAGVTKLSDAAVALLVELGVSLPSGGLYLAAPNSVGATFGFASKGTGQSTTNQTGHTAPKNAVLTGIGDIAGDIASLRVNGVATTGITDQGTGNFGNYPLYIGARAGTSMYFNGRLYSLIVRGAQSTLSQIEATELYMKKKVGIA